MRAGIVVAIVAFAALARADSGPEVTLDVGWFPWSVGGIHWNPGPSVHAALGWRLAGHALGIGLSDDHSFVAGPDEVGALAYYRTPALVSSGAFALSAGIKVISAPPNGGCTASPPSPTLLPGLDASWKVGWLRAGFAIAEGGHFLCGSFLLEPPRTSVVVSYAPEFDPASAESAGGRAHAWRPFVELAGYAGFSVAPSRRGRPDGFPGAWMLAADLGVDAFRAGIRLDSPMTNDFDLSGMTGYAHAVASLGEHRAGFTSEMELGVGIANQPLPFAHARMAPSGVFALRIVRPFGPVRPSIAVEEIVQGTQPKGAVFATVIALGLGAAPAGD